MKKGNVSNLDTFPFFVLYDGDLCLHVSKWLERHGKGK